MSEMQAPVTCGETEWIRLVDIRVRRAVGGFIRRTQRFGSAIRRPRALRGRWRANSRSRAEPESEYYGDPGSTAEALTEDGFVRTGDLAQMERGGSFEYLTRMGDVLRLGGFLVSPAEIEAEVQAHPAVGGVVSAPFRGRRPAIALRVPGGWRGGRRRRGPSALRGRLAKYKRLRPVVP